MGSLAWLRLRSSTPQVPKKLQKDTSLELFNLSNYKPSDLNINLYKHLIASEYIQELTNFKPDLAKWDMESMAKLKSKDKKAWESLLACEI